MEHFSYFEQGITQVHPTKDISLQDCFKLIKESQYLKSATESLRSNPEKKDEKKKKLPYVTFSGSFTRRAVDALKERSTYFCVDLDHVGTLTDISKIEKRLLDTFTPAFSFISPSGDGLKIIFRVDPKAGKHEEYFRAIGNFIKSETGKNIDEACKDISRACFLCYDPDAMLNNNPATLSTDFLKQYLPAQNLQVVSENAKNGYDEKLYNEALSGLKLHFNNGNRNNFIAELAGSCHRRGVSETFCLNKCLEFQETGFGEKEIRTIIKSIYRNPSFDPQGPGMADLEKRLLVDMSKEPEAAPGILFYKETPFACLQDFTLITGKAKVKKTFLSVLLVASYLGYENELIKSDRRGQVLWFDTEQSPHYFYKTLNRICRMTEQNPQLKGYNLKTLAPPQKAEFIEYVVTTTPDVRLVVIDGIRDLVFDINSPEEATKTSVRLMKWCAEYNLHAIVVLHQNKSDGNARGHLGTELVNKAQTVFSVSITDDKKISIVEPEYTRDLDFPKFTFTINDNSLPELCDLPETDPEKKIIPKPNQLTDDRHFQVLNGLYRGISEYPTYKELTDLIIEGFGYCFGESKCRTYISYYLSRGWIAKTRDGHKMIYKYERAIC